MSKRWAAEADDNARHSIQDDVTGHSSRFQRGVFLPTSQVHGAQTDLQDNQRPGLCLPSPYPPQHVAGNEATEAQLAPAWAA